MKKRFLVLLLTLAMLLSILAPVAAASPTTPDIRVIGQNLLNQPGVITNWEKYFTVNIRGEQMLDILARYDADTIGFQEANMNWKNFLEVNLKNYEIAPNTEKSSNPIYYNTTRMTLLDSGVFWLSDTPDYPSKNSIANEERTCTWAIVKNNTNGVVYAHFNTHLDHISDGARTEGMRTIRERIEGFREESGIANLGFIVTGDFNGNRTTPAYAEMIKEYPNVNMQDSLFCAPADQIVNEGATMLDWGLMINTEEGYYDDGLAIDHIFVSIDTLDVRYYKVMRESGNKYPTAGASDHFGVYLELNAEPGEVRRTDTNFGLTAAVGTPTIDGVMDEIYQQSSCGTTKNVYDSTVTQIPADGHTSAKYYFTRDDDNLYYFIDVTDAHVTDADKLKGQNGSGDAWEVDSIEIYYNFLKGTTNPTSYTAESTAAGDAGYFRVFAHGGNITAANMTATTEAAINGYVAKHTATGYTIEGKIPLSDSVKLQLAGSKDVQIGFSFRIDDDADNGAGSRDYMILSGGESDVFSCWANPSGTAPLFLKPGLSSASSAIYGTAVVDGVMDEVYRSTKKGTFEKAFNNNGDTVVLPDSELTTANYYLVWDNSYIYYFIDVIDAHVTDASKTTADDGSAYGVDCIEIYFDLLKGSGPNSYDWGANNGYFTVYAHGGETKKGWIPSEITAAIDGYVAKHTATGYAIEGKIPMTNELLAKLATNDEYKIGFGLMIQDDADNGANGRDYLVLSSGEGDTLSAWSSPNNATSIYLSSGSNASDIVTDGTIDTSVQRAAYGTPTIDGDLDDVWTKSTTDTFHLTEKTTTTNGVYRFLHDDDYLYFFADIQDSTPTSDTTVDQMDMNGIDGLQIYYDFLNTDYDSATNPSNWGHYNWGWINQNADEGGYFNIYSTNRPIGANIGPIDGISYQAKKNATGYTLEGKIPLSASLKTRLENGTDQTIGFGLQLNDDENDDGVRDCWLFSHEKTISVWSQPYNMTDLILEPKDTDAAKKVVYGTAKVDGAMDEAYEAAPTIMVNKAGTNNSIVSDFATGSFKALYDDENLYLFVQVEDDTPNSKATLSTGSGGNIDSVQIFFDYTDGTGSWSSENGYFTINGANQDPGNSSVKQYKFRKTDSGYNVEVSIALSDDIRARIANSETINIGLGVQINDDTNDDGNREGFSFSESTLYSAWSSPSYIDRVTMMPSYKIQPDFGTDKGTLNITRAFEGQSVQLDIELADGMMLVEDSVTIDGQAYTLGDTFVMPAHDVSFHAQITSKPTEWPIVLPTVEGLKITCDKQTAKPGEIVSLNIELEEGYEFLQDDGMYDYGHWSNSSQKWKYFQSSNYGWYMMGRRLKMNNTALIWHGNSFIMPDAPAVITAEVEYRGVAEAVKSTIQLDGEKDAAYDDSTALDVKRNNEQPIYYTDGQGVAFGTVYSAYDDEYLYLFAKVTDPTLNTLDARNGDISADKSLAGFDSIEFYVDFLNTDDANVATNRYPFVEGESGMILIDALDQKTANSGAVYNKFGGGFSSYNGDSSKADYVVKTNDTGYTVEVKLALSDSFRTKLANATEDEPAEIGLGAVIADDKNNNGGWDYENGDQIVVSSSLMANLWSSTFMKRTEDNHIEVYSVDSPRWLSTLRFLPGEDDENLPGSVILPIIGGIVSGLEDDCPSAGFRDVPGKSHWSHAGIDFCISNGLLRGTSTYTFSPDVGMTRAMLATVLHRMEGSPAPAGANPFRDVASGKWYTDAIVWAAENGITDGVGNDCFAPDDLLTREQLAALLYRYASYKGYDAASDTSLSNFADAGDVSGWASNAMKWAYANGILTGSSQNGKLYLNPKATATRAQVAAMLMRYCDVFA